MARPIWLTYFDALPDPRVQRTRRHKLSDILLIVLIGAICDCRGWDEMHEFIEDGPVELRSLLELPHGVPCADTIRRVISALDPVAFRDAFMAWARDLCKSTDGKLISIDGKSVRGAGVNEAGAGALHLINAWVNENAMVLGQYATDVKSNEITAIPELLKLLDIRGAIVSIDAMGCQKNIAKIIQERGADYVFGLKGNHPTLQREVLASFDAATCDRLAQSTKTFHAAADKGHGRNEYRSVWVLNDGNWLSHSDEWPGLKAVVLVQSERTKRGHTTIERRAYISSLEAPAERMFELVRGHWHVENKLHWVLDVTFGEDRTKIAKKNGAENLALVRKIALNLLRAAPARGKRASVVGKKKMAVWRFDYLLAVLSSGTLRN
jgi:predicted transposase YbfD/YdcC